MARYRRQEDPHGDRDDFANLRELSPYVWRYSRRVGMALACLLLSKLATVCIPIVLKGIIDSLDSQTDTGDLLTRSVVVVPMAMLIAYGALRLCSGFFSELRDILLRVSDIVQCIKCRLMYWRTCTDCHCASTWKEIPVEYHATLKGVPEALRQY